MLTVGTVKYTQESHTYFDERGGGEDFWGLKFWPKGIFWSKCMKGAGIFWGREKKQGFFRCQVKSTITVQFTA